MSDIPQEGGIIVKRKKCVALLVLLILVSSSFPASAASPKGLIQDSVKVLGEMARQRDAETMGELMKKARGVAVFPSVIKAGFVVGGQYGEGLLLRRDPATKKWYGPTFSSIAGASWGLQVGAQSTALVLVIVNERGLEGFKANNFKLGGDFAVAAGPVGRRAEMSTDFKLQASIYSYSMTKGLFAGLSLDGSAITVDKETNKAYWGKDTTPTQALNKQASGAEIRKLMDELERCMKTAR